MVRLPPSPAPLVFSAVLLLTATIALLPGEFTHYKRFLDLAADETGFRLVVVSAILSKTLVAILLCLLLLFACARFVGPRSLRSLALATGLLLLGFIGIDLELQKNTGNNIGHYLPFLLDPDTFVWAGQAFDARPGVMRVARNLLFALAPAGGIAWILERWIERSPARRGWILLSGILVLASSALVAAPVLQHARGAPGLLYHLNERMPWSWNAAFSLDLADMNDTQRDAQALYTRALPNFTSPRSFAPLLQTRPPARRPDILVVAIESLRHDAMDPDTMPRLWSWSQQGVRLDSHYATSNASHYGMFALLYGRSPLFYFETLDSGEPPSLPAQLREWGYTTHYVTCTDTQWREMDRFLGSRDFTVERIFGDSLPECDREVVSRTASLMEPGDRPPRFVLAFLMSTHFGYHFPAGAEVFRPSLPPPNALELDATRDRVALFNRYRNSAHSLDSLIGSLLDRIDPQNTLVVVTGDHGESLFDDGTIAHSSLLSEIQTRVPLVLTGPGVIPGAARPGPTDHSDLLPTLLARLGVEPELLQGYSGRDLQGDAASDFVPLVFAKAGRSEDDRVALVSRQHRYELRLDAELGELLFLGRFGVDGHPSHESVSQAEGAAVVSALDHYFERLGSR